jgi:hypothetical protein
VVRGGVIGTDETVESGAGDLAAMVILTCQARIWASCCRKCRYPVSRQHHELVILIEHERLGMVLEVDSRFVLRTRSFPVGSRRAASPGSSLA